MERRKVCDVLITIQEKEQTISNIAKKSQVTKPTVRKILNKLERRGLIIIRKIPKYVYVSITKEGLILRHDLLVKQEEDQQCQIIKNKDIFQHFALETS